MDTAALIFAPLILALIYSIPRVSQLPFLVRVGVPVTLLAALFIALVGYGPAVQETVMTNTPLLRTFDSRLFALHLDGLSLLFALLITGIGAVIALYASAVFEEGDVYRRFIRWALVAIGAMLGFVLTDHAEMLSFYWAIIILFPIPWLFNFGRVIDTETTQQVQWKESLKGLAYVAPYWVLRFGLSMLQDAGAGVKQMTQLLVEVSLLSSANLSKAMSYELFFAFTLAPLVVHSLYVVWRWQSAKHMSAPMHTLLSTIMILSSTYILARLYPAIHDNLLWWSVVTGIGLFIMLIGAIWALRQSDLKAILIYRSMSAFGACIALLGLPEFLGVKVALIGIAVHALSQAALFLNLDNTHKQSRLIIIVLALLPIAIFHVLMIGAFYQVTLVWSGIALSIVVLSTALSVVSAIRIIRSTPSQTDSVGTQRAAPSLSMITGILALASLLFIALFDPIFGPLLYRTITAQRLAGDTMTPLILGIIAIIGGAILYATRETWAHRTGAASLSTLDNQPEV